MLIRARAAFPYLILLNCQGSFESDLGNNGEKREKGVEGAKKKTGVATVAADKIAIEQKGLPAHKRLGGSCGSRIAECGNEANRQIRYKNIRVVIWKRMCRNY